MINSYKIKKSGTVLTIQDFLTNPDSFDLSNIQKDWWYVSINPTENGKVDLLDNKENFKEICINRDYSLNYYNSGCFSYCFRRTIDDHFNTCLCEICQLKKLFTSEEMKSEFSKIVGENVTSINETFCSKYHTCDYLSTHHDKKNGDYAFVYQLTKYWNPAHGAILNFWNSDTKELNAIYPEYNSLTIFKIKDIQNTDHFVSMNSSSETRYAFSGWFTC
jgi:Rps23 Pro-64 3,4-dihydroxylase Tpa1-like proline 4-hydroxylase